MYSFSIGFEGTIPMATEQTVRMAPHKGQSRAEELEMIESILQWNSERTVDGSEVPAPDGGEVEVKTGSVGSWDDEEDEQAVGRHGQQDPADPINSIKQENYPGDELEEGDDNQQEYDEELDDTGEQYPPDEEEGEEYAEDDGADEFVDEQGYYEEEEGFEEHGTPGDDPVVVVVDSEDGIFERGYHDQGPSRVQKLRGSKIQSQRRFIPYQRSQARKQQDLAEMNGAASSSSPAAPKFRQYKKMPHVPLPKIKVGSKRQQQISQPGIGYDDEIDPPEEGSEAYMEAMAAVERAREEEYEEDGEDDDSYALQDGRIRQELINVSVGEVHSVRRRDCENRCHFCPKKFETPEEVENHLDYCIQSRPFECQDCAKRFKTRAGLDQHARIHQNYRPYACSFCSKQFTQKCHVDQHERIHTGAKPFVCSFCGKGFRQRSGQQQHEMTHLK